jgi:hypothetical protein
MSAANKKVAYRLDKAGATLGLVGLAGLLVDHADNALKNNLLRGGVDVQHGRVPRTDDGLVLQDHNLSIKHTSCG